MANGYSGHPGGVDSWEYLPDERGFQGGMLHELGELPALKFQTITGMMRFSNLRPPMADYVAACLEDCLEHLTARCNQKTLRKIVKAAENDDLQQIELLLPATGRAALVQIHKSMAGYTYDFMLQAFAKSLRPIDASLKQIDLGENEIDFDEEESDEPERRGEFDRGRWWERWAA